MDMDNQSLLEAVLEVLTCAPSCCTREPSCAQLAIYVKKLLDKEVANIDSAPRVVSEEVEENNDVYSLISRQYAGSGGWEST